MNHKDLFRNSENKRGELQVHIEKTSIKIKADTTDHTVYQTELINENEKLKQEIQRLKAFHSSKEQEHMKDVDQMQKNFHKEMQDLNDSYNR